MTRVETILKIIQERDIKFIDLRFVDTCGKEQHISVSSSIPNKNFFEEGKMFDGSSIKGWKPINDSDMILKPDLQAQPILDPFCDKPTLIVRCDVIDPSTMKPYALDPRTIAKRAEAYLKETGIADTCYFGPEAEFFIFDSVCWENNMRESYFRIDSKEGIWNSGIDYKEGNMGHRPCIKGGYFPVPPVDSLQNIRSAICVLLEETKFSEYEDDKILIQAHHHEVGTGGQCEIEMVYKSLLKMGDALQVFKYFVQNVAHSFGKTATFMPKPLVGENGSGMHCHQSLAKNGQNIFAGDRYAGLSELALFYIGGIIKHAKALNAFTNSTTNSYKRLVPGFEAPVLLAYSSLNRSAAIRIPFAPTPQGRRVEVRFPDASSNAYLAFSAMMMAGLDGIQNKIHPGEPVDKDLYTMSPKETKKIPKVCASLEEAISSLEKDHEFLLKGGVFSEGMLKSYIEIKRAEIERLQMATHPIEFDMYYSL